jgi:hypothetical protein
MRLTALDKIISQNEEVIITGYDKASRMEVRADRMVPLRVETKFSMKLGGKW